MKGNVETYELTTRKPGHEKEEGVKAGLMKNDYN